MSNHPKWMILLFSHLMTCEPSHLQTSKIACRKQGTFFKDEGSYEAMVCHYFPSLSLEDDIFGSSYKEYTPSSVD